MSRSSSSKRGHLSVDISVCSSDGSVVGTVFYGVFAVGQVSGTNVEGVNSQFNSICDLVENHGASVRESTIMVGYHNGVDAGDVLSLDGEVLGSWRMQVDDDWSEFTAAGASELTCTAPSAWMLQDRIGRWLSGSDE